MKMKSEFKAAIICIAAILIIPAIWLGIGYSIRTGTVVATRPYEENQHENDYEIKDGSVYTTLDLAPEREGNEFLIVFRNHYTADKVDDEIVYVIESKRGI